MSIETATEMQAAPAPEPAAIVEVDVAKATTDKESMVFGPRKFCGEKRAMRLALLALCVVLLAVSVIVITQIAAVDEVDDPQDFAFLTLQEMMEDGVDNDDHAAFDVAFDTFDTNNDGALDEAEFSAFFEREMSYSHEFERMDGDGDNVLSYPEAVVYVREMGKIEALMDYLVDSLSGGIASAFGFELDVESEESVALFLEYAAVVMYFSAYDEDLNGYVHHKEFSAIAATNEWDSLPKEEDAEEGTETLSRDAFFDVLYGEDEYSWAFALHEMYGDDAEATVSAWAEVQIPGAEEVRSAEILLNPIQLLRDAERQQDADPNTAKYGMDLPNMRYVPYARHWSHRGGGWYGYRRRMYGTRIRFGMGYQFYPYGY